MGPGEFFVHLPWQICTPNFVPVSASRRWGITLWCFLSDFLCPVGGAMMTTVLMHRYIQGDSLYIPERFGVEGELYVEVTRTWCFMAKDLNWPHHHGQQVWCRRKLLTGFHLQGLRMILTDCEVCCVKSVGGCHYSARIGNISKWRPQSKWPT